ncbi:MAG: 4Fe-4S dicluster domain-containing protein [Candidatus Aegiribacteria sp.]|nr:4Fe-4S dicluster domain-containing protein [Candidatus Aegiribacteria sp.]
MIKIIIDEDACVGCELCVDECPTDVFEFNEEKKIPEVVREKECFGCLSCSEICPATAITHEDIVHSEDYYHDEENLKLASKLAVDVPLPNTPSDEAHRKAALDDLGIRLLAVASIFRQTLGGSLPAVGTMAGRTLATQLPKYRIPESFQEVLDIAVQQFSPAWDINTDYNGSSKLEIKVGACFIRELCGEEGIELGGDLCVLFYNYMAGYVGKMGNRRLRLIESCPGSKECRYDVELFVRK